MHSPMQAAFGVALTIIGLFFLRRLVLSWIIMLFIRLRIVARSLGVPADVIVGFTLLLIGIMIFILSFLVPTDWSQLTN